MTQILGELLDPREVVGTGELIPAGGFMEVGVLRKDLPYPVQEYDIQGPLVYIDLGTTAPTFSKPMVLPTQLVSREYIDALTHGTRMKRTVAMAYATNLERDARHLSRVRGVRKHPFFDYLAHTGRLGVSVALQRLSGENRPLWLFFLQEVTGERPAAGAPDADEAANRWQSWGRARGLLV